MCKYTRIHFGSFCVLFLEIKFLGDKEKINAIKNVKRRKLCFMMLSFGLINELFYKTLKMAM